MEKLRIFGINPKELNIDNLEDLSSLFMMVKDKLFTESELSKLQIILNSNGGQINLRESMIIKPQTAGDSVLAPGIQSSVLVKGISESKSNSKEAQNALKHLQSIGLIYGSEIKGLSEGKLYSKITNDIFNDYGLHLRNDFDLIQVTLHNYIQFAVYAPKHG